VTGTEQSPTQVPVPAGDRHRTVTHTGTGTNR